MNYFSNRFIFRLFTGRVGNRAISRRFSDSIVAINDLKFVNKQNKTSLDRSNVYSLRLFYFNDLFD